MTSSADAANARRVETDSHRHLRETFAVSGMRTIVDLGCGTGETSRHLADHGFDVLGIDPSSEAISAALRHLRPGLRFSIGRAEEMLASTERFDGAFFLNALHHVAPDCMSRAVMAALRLLRPGGLLLVIEPLAEGSYFNAMRAVEDESEIRAAAADTIANLRTTARVRQMDLLRWDRVTRFPDRRAFLERLVAVDPARVALVKAHDTAIGNSWSTHAQPAGDGFVLTQPMLCWHLALPD